jgi:hypothetical protein
VCTVAGLLQTLPMIVPLERSPICTWNFLSHGERETLLSLCYSSALYILMDLTEGIPHLIEKHDFIKIKKFFPSSQILQLVGDGYSVVKTSHHGGIRKPQPSIGRKCVVEKALLLWC